MDPIYNFVSENLTIKKKTDLGFPFLDYGFLYGYGLFETIRIENGRAQLLQEHIARIKKSALFLEIPFMFSDNDIVNQVEHLIQQNNVEQCILNFYLTPGDRGVDPTVSNVESPFFLIVMRQWPGYLYEQRLRLDVRQESFQKTPLDRLKTLAWMKNILENRLSEGFEDVMLFDSSHCILETSRSNVFFVKGDTLVVPQSKVILEGVMRAYIMTEATNMGYALDKREVYLEELGEFDEIFLSNALRGVVLVDSLNGFAGLRSKDRSLAIQHQCVSSLK